MGPLTARAGVPAPITAGWTLWLPMPPKAFNKATNNWQATHYPRKRWMLNASLAAMNQLGTPLPTAPAIALGLTFYVAREHDADNLEGMRKHIYDLLKRGKGGLGIVPDDTPAHIIPDGFPKQVIVPAARKRKTETEGQFNARKLVHAARYGVRLKMRPLLKDGKVLHSARGGT